MIKTIATYDLNTQSILKHFNNKLCAIPSNSSHYRFPNYSCEHYGSLHLHGSYARSKPACVHPAQYHGNDDRIKNDNNFTTLPPHELPQCPISFKVFNNNTSNQGTYAQSNRNVLPII